MGRLFFKEKDVLRFLVVGLLIILIACDSSGRNRPQPTSQSAKILTPSPTVTKGTTLKPPATVLPVPSHYTSRLLLKGVGRPDDVALDSQGRLLFSDAFHGTISRLNKNGSVSLLVRDPTGPEGIVVLPNGTIVYAEQDTNRIVSLTPGAHLPTLVRQLPGVSRSLTCKHGVDGIAFDPTTNTLILPDSPEGGVYRMSLDGKILTLLAHGIPRPVGAGADDQGNIFIADECGHAIWTIAASPHRVARSGGFGMPDDVLSDRHGNLLILDLDPRIHALIRLNLQTGKREILARQGYIEPQGLALDTRGDIFVSDDYANSITEYMPHC